MRFFCKKITSLNNLLKHEIFLQKDYISEQFFKNMRFFLQKDYNTKNNLSKHEIFFLSAKEITSLKTIY